MLDRIIDIQATGGKYDRCFAVAELDISPESWFFKHHFRGDPIMPASFIVEAMWQLTGFHLAWLGHSGRGRVIDSGWTRFVSPVTPAEDLISIYIQILRRKNSLCIANGEAKTQNNLIAKSELIIIALV